jgi:DNA-binding PadR family transcriptional regulator
MSTSKTIGRLRGDCPCRGATLAKLVQPAILALLAEGGLHGYDIVQRAAELPTLRGSRPDPTGVYRLLRAMSRRGLLAAAWDASEKGPAKRCYTLTPAGRDCLAAWVVTLRAYHRSLEALLNLTRRAAGRTRKKGCCCS